MLSILDFVKTQGPLAVNWRPALFYLAAILYLSLYPWRFVSKPISVHSAGSRWRLDERSWILSKSRVLYAPGRCGLSGTRARRVCFYSGAGFRNAGVVL